MTPNQRIGIQLARKLSTVTNNTIVKKGHAAFADDDLFNRLIVHLENLIAQELQKSFDASIIDRKSDLHWRWQLLKERRNLVHGYPAYTLALLLFKNFQPNTAIIINAANNEEYSAADGSGAMYGNQRIRVNSKTNLDILYSGDTQLPGKKREQGSTLLSIGLAARGSLNAICYSNLNPFEISIAHLLLGQAGARCCDFQGEEGRSGVQLLAGESKLVRRLLIAVFKQPA